MQEDDDPPIRVRVVSDSAEKATHGPVHAFRWSKDFRSLNWGGREFPPFTFTQAACMKTLWEHLQNGTRWMAQATILDEAASVSDSRKPQLRDVFGKHPAWGVVIVSGGKGVYGLADPPFQEK